MPDRVDDGICQEQCYRDGYDDSGKIILADFFHEILRHFAYIEPVLIIFGKQVVDIDDDQQDGDQ